ncbi:S-adenosyl-L-methionine-dependent methyltransferase [Aspergillus unguis]
MASVPFGFALTKIFASAPLLGFLPVAAELNVFDILVKAGKEVTGEDVLVAYKNDLGSAANPGPGLLLFQDTLQAMAGLGVIDAPAGNTYSANALTRHLVAHPSSLHGGLHYTKEILLAGTFLLPKLKATNFEYPFAECETPMQFAHKQMGNEQYAKMHTYATMGDQGRMDSFNTFMEGKFFDLESNALRIQKLGYDIGRVLETAPAGKTKMVDIGGGRGELLLQIKETLPDLQSHDLVVEEFNDDLGDIKDVTLIPWNYKDTSTPQPIKGAVIYHLAHVLHNLPDLDAVRLLQRVAEVMEPHSRILVHEMARTADMAFLHAAMILLYGGRERTSEEFRHLAEAAGLKVTFEKFPEKGDGLVEMMKP